MPIEAQNNNDRPSPPTFRPSTPIAQGQNRNDRPFDSKLLISARNDRISNKNDRISNKNDRPPTLALPPQNPKFQRLNSTLPLQSPKLRLQSSEYRLLNPKLQAENRNRRAQNGVSLAFRRHRRQQARDPVNLYQKPLAKSPNLQYSRISVQKKRSVTEASPEAALTATGD